MTPTFGRFAEHFVDDPEVLDLDLRIRERAFRHDLAGPEHVAAKDHVHLAGELGQVGRFFDGRVAAADHDQRLVAKAGQGAVADGTRRDAVVLEMVLRWQAEVVRPAPGGDNHGMGFDRFERPIDDFVLFVAIDRGQAKRALLEIDLDHVLRHDARAEIDRLLAASTPSVRGR